MFKFMLTSLALQYFFLLRHPLFSLGQWRKAEIAAVDIIVHFITTNADADIMVHTIKNTTDAEINAGMGTTIVGMVLARESVILKVTETVYKTISKTAYTAHRYRMFLSSNLTSPSLLLRGGRLAEKSHHFLSTVSCIHMRYPLSQRCDFPILIIVLILQGSGQKPEDKKYGPGHSVDGY
jgi:hypothetical protein